MTWSVIGKGIVGAYVLAQGCHSITSARENNSSNLDAQKTSENVNLVFKTIDFSYITFQSYHLSYVLLGAERFARLCKNVWLAKEVIFLPIAGSVLIMLGLTALLHKTLSKKADLSAIVKERIAAEGRALAHEELGAVEADALDEKSCIDRVAEDRQAVIKQEVEEELNVKWDLPGSIRTRQALLIASIAYNIIFLYLNFTPFYLAITAMQMISLINIARKNNWLKFEKSFAADQCPNLVPRSECDDESHAEGMFQGIDLSCYFNLIPREESPEPSEDNNCNVCLEPKPKQYYFCDRHSYCNPCLIRTVEQSVRHIFSRENLQYTIRTSSYNSKREMEVNYVIVVEQTKLLKCPECRGQPSFKLSMVAKEDRRDVSAVIKAIKDETARRYRESHDIGNFQWEEDDFELVE